MKSILIAWLLIGALCGCETKRKTVCFLAPDGFEGVFRVIEDPKAWVPPTSDSDTTFYRLGARRTIIVSNAKALKKWHVLELRYASGKTVNSFVKEGNAADITLVRALFATASGEFYFYVGPENGVERAREDAEELLNFR